MDFEAKAKEGFLEAKDILKDSTWDVLNATHHLQHQNSIKLNKLYSMLFKFVSKIFPYQLQQ